MTDPTRQRVLFPDLLSKPLHIAFDDPAQSSEGGSVLLAAVDRRLGLTSAMAGCLRDRRREGSIAHSYAQMLTQRVYGIALGYEDANDADRLRGDVMMRLMVAGDSAGKDLASQPSLSRFENAVTNVGLYGMGTAMAGKVFDFHRKRLGRRVRQITIDMDPTDTPNHGEQQELSFYNGHYDNYCYLPMLCFVSFEDEPDQYLFGAVLRPGNASAKVGALAILRRTLAMVRERFPKARVLVRLDGGFACPELFDFLDEQKRLVYVVAMGKNAVLERRIKRPMGTARRLSRQSGTSQALFGETLYAAKSWKDCKRRIVYKAEVVRLVGRDPRDNARFLVTNLRSRAERVFETYRMRGECENRIKELLHGLRLDRTSCSKFRANQLRVLMTAAAYVLMQTMRCPLAKTSLARKQVDSLRLMLLKIGARVVASARRTVVHLAGNHAWYQEWLTAARIWGAVPA
ncbi:MAG TPA: IS1380 family transposase [Candidatus Binatia bacterium]|nr:IS1380 family transposase [Candidatus Binatia bacterium]